MSISNVTHPQSVVLAKPTSTNIPMGQPTENNSQHSWGKFKTSIELESFSSQIHLKLLAL
jgi:hypothetical protein